MAPPAETETEISPCPPIGTDIARGRGGKLPQKGRESLPFSVRLSGAHYDFRTKKGARLLRTERGTGTVSFLTPVRNYVDALVHPAARQDALTAARHRTFIAPRLLGSFAALAAFPFYIAVRGVPSLIELGVFGW